MVLVELRHKSSERLRDRFLNALFVGEIGAFAAVEKIRKLVEFLPNATRDIVDHEDTGKYC